MCYPSLTLQYMKIDLLNYWYVQVADQYKCSLGLTSYIWPHAFTKDKANFETYHIKPSSLSIKPWRQRWITWQMAAPTWVGARPWEVLHSWYITDGHFTLPGRFAPVYPIIVTTSGIASISTLETECLMVWSVNIHLSFLGKKNNHPLSPAFVPSLFSHVSAEKRQRELKAFERRQDTKRRKLKEGRRSAAASALLDLSATQSTAMDSDSTLSTDSLCLKGRTAAWY